MSAEINNPPHTTYFVARSADGSVLHVGETQPGQVTTTGQPVLELSGGLLACFFIRD